MRPELTRRAAPSSGHQARQANRHPAFTLQRAAGNRATAQLLQREPTNAARLAKVAKQLGTNVDERDIHLAQRVKEGEDHGVRPGLNIVANLPTRGRTGFVESSGKYHGDFVTATRDGELPGVAIMLGPQVFRDGDDGILSTLRHELAHAEHDRVILSWLTRWRRDGHGALDTWMRRQKASPVDLALVHAGTNANRTDTELLAHIEGFAAVFDKSPPPSASVVRRSSLPLAIEELRGAAEHGWSGVDPAVKTLAEKRLSDFYRGLDANHQALLRDWLFYLRYRAITPWPRDATDDDAKAASLVRNLFQPYIGFLDWLLNIVANIEFAAHTLPRPANAQPVDKITRKAPARTLKIGAGKVTAYADVGFRFAGDSHSHGISLSYEGADASEMRWLQFIWREARTDQGEAISGPLYHQGQEYPLTTNPSEPSQIGWNTDTATYLGGPDSAFYEKDNATNRSAGKLEMFDEPSAPAVKSAPNPGVSRAHLVQYLVKGRSVLVRTEFEIEHGSSQAGAKPRLVSVRPAGAIDPGPRARLHAQFKDLDYLP